MREINDNGTNFFFMVVSACGGDAYGMVDLSVMEAGCRGGLIFFFSIYV